MCYNRRDHGFEEEARSRLRQHEEEEAWEEAHRRGREVKARQAGEREKKPLTEKVREVVGSAT
jgi:hypothetical protein